MYTTQRVLEKPLVSNGFTLENSPELSGWLTPSDPRTPIELLRERYNQEGYLWLKSILNRDEVLAFRRRYFTALADTGLLAEGYDFQAGIYSGRPYDKEVVHRVMMEVVRWAAYEAFCLARPIIEFYEALFESPVYLHKRKLIRFNKPGEEAATGGHYDQIYLRDGTDQFCSSWIPVGDTPVEMGGLLYLEGSQALGQQLEAKYLVKVAGLPHAERINAFKGGRWDGWLSEDLATLAQQSGKRWLAGDYQAGDMLVHIKREVFQRFTLLIELSLYFNVSINLALLKAKMPYDSFTLVFLPWVC